MFLRFVLLSLLGASMLGGTESPSEGQPCSSSPTVRAKAPAERAADPVVTDFFINEDRTIWAGWIVQDGLTPWSPGRMKTYWVRPQGTQLIITGRRLDAPADPVDAWVPCCYPTGFQIVGLRIPTEGCWEVHAKAGQHELRFVTLVKSVSPSQQP